MSLCHSPQRQPIIPGFPAVVSACPQTESPPPPLACSEDHLQWSWGITFPCTLWFRCPGCKNTWIKVITLVIVI